MKYGEGDRQFTNFMWSKDVAFSHMFLPRSGFRPLTDVKILFKSGMNCCIYHLSQAGSWSRADAAFVHSASIL